MSRGVKPLQISPIIKCARWALFVSGVFYGFTRRKALEVYEATAGVQRRMLLEKELERRYLESQRRTKEDIREIIKQINSPEIGGGMECDMDF